MKRVVALALLALLAAACGSSSKAEAPVEQPPLDLRGKKTVEVEANANLFSPATIEITEGTTVTWHNTDTVAHDVQKSSDAEDFGAPFGVRVPDFGPGQSYSFTFDEPGTYFYTCTIHTGMNGKIQVEAAGAATTGSVTSTTAVG